MENARRPVLSCVLAPALDTPAHIELAERLGYRRAWCYDSPAMYADPWMILALAAARTRAIGLGPAVLVPSLRHPLVSAAALATLAGLAPGRVSAAFGTGLTGRLLLGERPLPWAQVERYVTAVRALLRGEETDWNGRPIAMAHPAGFAASRPADVTVLIAADGPKGAAVAEALADGTLTARAPAAGPAAPSGGPPASGRPVVLLAFGTVLDEGEDPAGDRARAAAGPAIAAAYHAIYESRGAAGVDKLPGGQAWRAAVEAADESRRHLVIHDGHLAVPGPLDAELLRAAAPLLTRWTMTGPPARIAARLAELAAAGVTEIAYQPMGPDIPRELTAFAAAAAGPERS